MYKDKERQKEYLREYRERNKLRIRSQWKIWYRRNHNKILTKARERYRRSKEETRDMADNSNDEKLEKEKIIDAHIVAAVRSLFDFSKISDEFQEELRRAGERETADALAEKLTDALLEAREHLYQARVAIGTVRPS